MRSSLGCIEKEGAKDRGRENFQGQSSRIHGIGMCSGFRRYRYTNISTIYLSSPYDSLLDRYMFLVLQFGEAQTYYCRQLTCYTY